MQISSKNTNSLSKNAKPSKQELLTAEMAEGLKEYHQLDGYENHGGVKGVQLAPNTRSEKTLRAQNEKLANFLGALDDIEVRPSPKFDPARGKYRKEIADKAAPYVEKAAKELIDNTLEMIHDKKIADFCKEALKATPDEFFVAPSSSSGKFHPADEINKGGLVEHSCRNALLADHLADFFKLSQHDHDIVVAASLLHDSWKGGEDWHGPAYAQDHGDVAAHHIPDVKGANTKDGKLIARLVGNHMAQWNKTAEGKEDPRVPADKLEQIVSYADYLGSRDNVYVIPKGLDGSYLNGVSSEAPPANNSNGNSTAPLPSEEDEKYKFFTKGNKVEPLFDKSVTPKDNSDEIFTQVRKAIDGATRSIQLEMFGLGQEDIVDKLIAKHKAGVAVQVVLDPVNEDWEAEKTVMANKLIKAGVDVQWYPVRPADDKHKFEQIDHIKMLVVDGDEAIIGGMNWGSHSPENHDVDVHVRGPVVNKMQLLFNKDYEKSGGKHSLEIVNNAPLKDGNSYVSLATTSDDPGERQVKAALHRAIRNATKSIECELFFLTDWSLIGALKDAKARGVDVKVLLNPSMIDGFKHNEKACKDLRAAGCEVKWHVNDPKTGSKLHAKMAVFDGEEVVLGSTNWSGNGLTWNREANVDIADKDVAGAYHKMFVSDFKEGAQDPVYLEEQKVETDG